MAEEMQNTRNLLDFSNEILAIIVKELDVRSSFQMRSTCKQLADVVNENRLFGVVVNDRIRQITSMNRIIPKSVIVQQMLRDPPREPGPFFRRSNEIKRIEFRGMVTAGNFQRIIEGVTNLPVLKMYSGALSRNSIVHTPAITEQIPFWNSLESLVIQNPRRLGGNGRPDKLTCVSKIFQQPFENLKHITYFYGPVRYRDSTVETEFNKTIKFLCNLTTLNSLETLLVDLDTIENIKTRIAFAELSQENAKTMAQSNVKILHISAPRSMIRNFINMTNEMTRLEEFHLFVKRPSGYNGMIPLNAVFITEIETTIRVNPKLRNLSLEGFHITAPYDCNHICNLLELEAIVMEKAPSRADLVDDETVPEITNISNLSQNLTDIKFRNIRIGTRDIESFINRASNLKNVSIVHCGDVAGLGINNQVIASLTEKPLMKKVKIYPVQHHAFEYIDPSFGIGRVYIRENVYENIITIRQDGHVSLNLDDFRQ